MSSPLVIKMSTFKSRSAARHVSARRRNSHIVLLLAGMPSQIRAQGRREAPSTPNAPGSRFCSGFLFPDTFADEQYSHTLATQSRILHLPTSPLLRRTKHSGPMANPNQYFLLADHIKLSLLERQRAISLNLEPTSQDGHISRSLDSLREGLENVTKERVRLQEAGDLSWATQCHLMKRLTVLLAHLLHSKKQKTVFDHSTMI
jgi:hypothetical protein